MRTCFHFLIFSSISGASGFTAVQQEICGFPSPSEKRNEIRRSSINFGSVKIWPLMESYYTLGIDFQRILGFIPNLFQNPLPRLYHAKFIRSHGASSKRKVHDKREMHPSGRLRFRVPRLRGKGMRPFRPPEGGTPNQAAGNCADALNYS
jgi:hypothetical protein